MNTMSKKIFAPMGAAHLNNSREEHDFYATDPKAIKLLKSAVDLPEMVWEPACGNGLLSEELIRQGHKVFSSDLVYRDYKPALTPTDFLKTSKEDVQAIIRLLTPIYTPHTPEYTPPFAIVTNPPYKLAVQFILHALDIMPENGILALLLRTLFVEGQQRNELIYSKNPPVKIIQSISRLQCAKNADFDNNVGTAMAFAWFVWHKHNDNMQTLLTWAD